MTSLSSKIHEMWRQDVSKARRESVVPVYFKQDMEWEEWSGKVLRPDLGKRLKSKTCGWYFLKKSGYHL